MTFYIILFIASKKVPRKRQLWEGHVPNVHVSKCMDTARNRGPISGSGNGFFSSPEHSQPLYNPPTVLCNVYQGVIPPGAKRPGQEADYSFLLMMNLKMKAAMPALLRMFSQLCYQMLDISGLLFVHFKFKTKNERYFKSAFAAFILFF